MFAILAEMLAYTFIRRALIVGILVSLCSSLLGVSLVLKRYSMIGDGLSHVGFGTLAVATAFGLSPLSVSIPVCVAVAFLLLRISENGNIKGDAAIALISTGSLAGGVVVISMTTGLNTDVCNFMFGSILAMRNEDVILSVVLCSVVLVLFVLFYDKIFAVTFDENFARATGTNTGLYNMVIAFLTAITIVLGMRMMGAMLISGLIIFPALTSMRVCKTFKSVTICSAAVSLFCFGTGVVGSYVYSSPTGASVVVVNIAMFLLFWTVGTLRKYSRPNKKLLATSLAVMLLLTGCAAEDDWRTADVIEIKEKMFIAQTNYIYLNADDYLGKTIKYEGIYSPVRLFDGSNREFIYVVRFGPGCCPGIDETAGFEVCYTGEIQATDGDWVEVEGVLETYQENGLNFLRLNLDSIQVKDVRGAETVEG